ncbi:hypothetical protein BHE74_00050916 [Ensete ventricosum]|nr:hypothetical protein BHE74_00050916 [Ensete ventricosum]
MGVETEGCVRNDRIRSLTRSRGAVRVLAEAPAMAPDVKSTAPSGINASSTRGYLNQLLRRRERLPPTPVLLLPLPDGQSDAAVGYGRECGTTRREPPGGRVWDATPPPPGNEATREPETVHDANWLVFFEGPFPTCTGPSSCPSLILSLI